ncbi:MAG: hypothetical protein GY888_27375 [Planctomycetaceae bacterium]|nr:hypothetical protein [Planctomycetaceae bacterium]
MRRDGFYRVMLAVAGITIMVFSGCRAPRPSFNFWAPFGASRVAPPQTGSYNTTPNYYPKEGAPAASGAPALPATTPPAATAPAFAPPPAGTTPVEPSNDFPIDSSSRSPGAGAAQSLEEVRVGRWRPPRHVPQVRPVSFEAAVSSKTVSPRVATVPAVAVPAKSLVVTETPRELSESQTRGAVPLTGKDSGSVPNPSVATDDASVQPASATTTVPAVISAGWSQREENRSE